MRWTLIPVVAGVALISPPLHAHGTGGGNEFFTHVNAAFDFQVGSPDDWSCNGCNAPAPAGHYGETTQVWAMAPALQPDPTGLRVTFIDGDKAKTLADLKAELDPTVSWTDIGGYDRGGFVGFSSSPLGNNASAATEYYLVTENRVIRIDWSKDPAGGHTGSAQQLDDVKGSINRVSEPPRIHWIRTDGTASPKIGDMACLLIGVSDVRGNLAVANLRALDIQGTLPHWSFKTIKWEADPGQFRVCYKVTSTFGVDGLRIMHMSIEVPEDGRGVDCDADDPTNSAKLTCKSLILYNGKDVATTITQTVAPVATSGADLAGPQIHGLTVDVDHLMLTIDADAGAGLASAEVFSADDKSQLVYADELTSGGRVSLARMVHEGWNTIDHVVVYDNNGVPTLLRRHAAPARYRRSHVLATETYETVSWTGIVTPTGIPVRTFLKAGGDSK